MVHAYDPQIDLSMIRSKRCSKTACDKPNIPQRRLTMWTKPEVTEMRFGFEVTMYVCNR